MTAVASEVPGVVPVLCVHDWPGDLEPDAFCRNYCGTTFAEWTGSWAVNEPRSFASAITILRQVLDALSNRDDPESSPASSATTSMRYAWP